MNVCIRGYIVLWNVKIVNIVIYMVYIFGVLKLFEINGDIFIIDKCIVFFLFLLSEVFNFFLKFFFFMLLVW